MSKITTTYARQKIGFPVQSFQLETLDKLQVDLFTILIRKKAAVVVFWSGICSHCVRYDTYLNTFTQRHPEIALLVVASRQGETAEQIRAAVTKRELTFPIVHDSDGRVAGLWAVHQTPRVFLLDPNLVLLYRGAIDNYKYSGDPEYSSYLETAIDEFLAQRPITRSEIASFGCAIQSIYYKFPKAL